MVATAMLLKLRKDPGAQLILLLCVVHLVPIWCFKFIPTQDGLSHVYNAYLLKEWNNPQFTTFREVYNLNLTLFPNWSSYAFFFVALHILPPLIAEKIFVTLIVLLFPLSFYYLLGAIDKRLRIFGLLGFLYSYNYLLQMGFYSFVLSVPLCLISIGYWWKHRQDFQIVHVAMLNLLLIATYFSHFSSYTLLVFALSFLAGVHFLAHLSQVGENIKKFSQFIGYLVPAYFILLNTLLSNPESRESKHRSFAELWDYFINAKSLVYFNDSYVPISWILLGFIGFCTVWTFIQRVRQKRLLEARGGFLLLAVILTVLYFWLPWQYGPPAWINDRVHLFIFPILLPWFILPERNWSKRCLIGVMLLMSLWHLGLTIRDYHLLNKDMKEFASGAHLIEPDSTVSILEQGTQWRATENHGPIKYLSPFYHGTAYYCLGNGSHYVANYEPKYSYFPLRYTNGNWKFKYVGGPIEYMLVWHADPKHEAVKALAKDYELIHETKNLKLFRHRSKQINNSQ
ncbi:MAG: hypothetical protein O7E52_07120 [Candidatus Poribacteria bacterium]|nr:hypothetical protein [Candidatus Poribacteria bacterium]